ncbi:MAG: transposase [Prosthecobacter sp.]|nr:transposase [Prosthecobacter sp.]
MAFTFPLMNEEALPWPHAPLHLLTEKGLYFVTAGTYQKEHHFRGVQRLEVLQRGLLKQCQHHGWRLEAWAVFSNHYHFVAESPGTAESLPDMLNGLHEKTAKWINKLDQQPSRKVWHNYRETLLTEQSSYFARLNYTHRNAHKHGLVTVASDYPWCSAAWFEEHTGRPLIQSIYRFKTDKIGDEYEPSADW